MKEQRNLTGIFAWTCPENSWSAARYACNQFICLPASLGGHSGQSTYESSIRRAIPRSSALSANSKFPDLTTICKSVGNFESGSLCVAKPIVCAVSLWLHFSCVACAQIASSDDRHNQVLHDFRRSACCIDVAAFAKSRLRPRWPGMFVPKARSADLNGLGTPDSLALLPVQKKRLPKHVCLQADCCGKSPGLAALCKPLLHPQLPPHVVTRPSWRKQTRCCIR